VVVAHLITLAVSPAITRIFTPEEFGIFSLFNSLVIILSMIATGTYEFSIVLPEKDKTARHLFRISLLGTLVFTLFCYTALFFTAPYLSHVTTLSIPFLLLLPAAVMFNSAMNSYHYWFTRKEFFDEYAYAKISMATGTGFFQVLIGLAGFTSVGLLIGLIAGRISAIITMTIRKFAEVKELYKSWNYQQLKNAASSYRDHPKFVLMSSLLSAISIELPVFLIMSLFGGAELGFYGLAFRILMAPVTLVSMSVGQVYFQKFSARKNSGQLLAPYLTQLWGYLFLIGIVPFTLLFFWSEPIFAFAFGADWLEAGTVASILTPMLLFTFIANPTSKSLLVLEQQKIMPLFSAASLIMRLATLLTGYYFFDFFIALWLMAGGQILVYIAQGAYTYHCSRTFDLKNNGMSS
jgi:O-antigen/teichoic acid export membrane protein